MLAKIVGVRRPLERYRAAVDGFRFLARDEIRLRDYNVAIGVGEAESLVLVGRGDFD
jgi:hypothetical protein